MRSCSQLACTRLERHQRQRQARLRAHPVRLRQRAAGELPNLERTLDPLRIIGFQALRGDGVDLRQLRMQRRPAVRCGLGVDRGPHLRVAFGQRIEPVEQGLHIQHRAAHQQRGTAARVDLGDQARGVGGEARGGVRVGRFDDVDQVVRHTRALGRARLGRADVHAAIDLRRVDAHDLQRHPFGERHRQRALAAGRRPSQHHRTRRLAHACAAPLRRTSVHATSEVRPAIVASAAK